VSSDAPDSVSASRVSDLLAQAEASGVGREVTDPATLVRVAAILRFSKSR